MSDGITYNQAQLALVLSFWQTVLSLRDWHMKANLARQFEMATEARLAEVAWSMAHRQASIRVLDPVDYRHDLDLMGLPQDMEEDLVHELLHVVLAGWAPPHDTPEHTAQEQAIIALSKALVNLRRGFFVDSFPFEKEG